MNSDELLRSVAKNLEQVRRELLELRFAVERLNAQTPEADSTHTPEVYAHHRTAYPESHHRFGESLAAGSPVEYSHHRSQSGGHLAIWIYQNGSWTFDPTSLPKGVSPGSPPNIEGEYEGQHVKTTPS